MNNLVGVSRKAHNTYLYRNLVHTPSFWWSHSSSLLQFLSVFFKLICVIDCILSFFLSNICPQLQISYSSFSWFSCFYFSIKAELYLILHQSTNTLNISKNYAHATSVVMLNFVWIPLIFHPSNF